jgi:hypothetical protein
MIRFVTRGSALDWSLRPDVGNSLNLISTNNCREVFGLDSVWGFLKYDYFKNLFQSPHSKSNSTLQCMSTLIYPSGQLDCCNINGCFTGDPDVVILAISCDLIRHGPDYSLPWRDAHKAREQAPPHGPQPLCQMGQKFGHYSSAWQIKVLKSTHT